MVLVLRMAKKGCETHHRLNQRAPESGSKTTAVHDLQKGLITMVMSTIIPKNRRRTETVILGVRDMQREM